MLKAKVSAGNTACESCSWEVLWKTVSRGFGEETEKISVTAPEQRMFYLLRMPRQALQNLLS